MPNIPPSALAIGVFVVALYLWAWGILCSSPVEAILAPFFLAGACCLLALVTPVGSVPAVGFMLFVFGAVSLLLGRVADEDDPVIRRSSLRAIGAGCCLLGVVMQLVL